MCHQQGSPCLKGLTHTHKAHTHSHTDVHSPRPSEQTHAGRVAHGKIIITPPSLPPLKKTTVCLENSRLLCLRSSRAEAKLRASPIVTKQRHKTVQVCVPVLETLMSERCGVFQLRRLHVTHDGLPDVSGLSLDPRGSRPSSPQESGVGGGNDRKCQRQHCCPRLNVCPPHTIKRVSG